MTPALVVTLLAGLAACSDTSGTSDPASPGDGPHFPVRLLPREEGGVTRVLLDDDLSDLTAWWLLTLDGRLVPAAGHAAVRPVAGGGVRLAHAGQALVRTVERPAREGGTASARLQAAGAVYPPGGSQWLQVLELRDELVAGGPDDPRLARWLRRRLRPEERADARWTTASDSRGMASLSTAFPAQDTAGTVVLLMAASGDDARLEHVQLSTRPQVIRLRNAQFYESAEAREPLTAPTVSPLRLGIHRRDALLIGPGQSHALEAVVPAGARGLWFGVGPLPGSPLGARSTWTITGSLDGGPATELGRGELVVASAVPIELDYTDVELDWPAAWADGGTLTLRVSVAGETELAIGQPLVRGPAREARPNLLLISIDTVRADHLGWHGYGRDTTPGLDAWVAGGTAFLNASSAAPYTLPSHASLLTGLLPGRHGAVDGGTDALDPGAVPYLPVLLAERGWHTAAFTGGGMMSSQYGFAGGFDRFRAFDPVNLMLAEGPLVPHRVLTPEIEAAARALQIEALPGELERFGDEPWFVFLHTFAAHNYTTPDEDLAAVVEPRDVRWGADHEEVVDYVLHWREQGVEPTRVERLRDLYDASLHHLDRRLAGFLSELEIRGLLDDTLVVLVSDHGEEFAEHGGLMHGYTLFEEMLHVPLVFRGPGVPAGRRVGESVTLTDVLPTVLELLGVDDVDADLDGRSLGPLLGERRSTPQREPRMVGHVATSQASGMSYRSGRYKLVRMRQLGADGDASQRWALYDLAADPDETSDIAPSRPDLVARLRQSLETLEADLARDGASSARAEIDPELARQLQALGYADLVHDDG